MTSPSSSSYKLELAQLSKQFGETSVLRGLDLQVQEGEFVVLVGPSGCGKSTVLRLIAGLEDPTQGDIRIEGQSVLAKEPKDRDIAMVFQNYALYPHMSVFDNMAFALKMRKTPKAEIEQRVKATAQRLQMEALLHRKPRELSGGQRQRVALGRAMVRNPKIFLMDEPLSNLDAKLRQHMRSELLELQRGLNATVLYVTHDQTEALTLGHRVVVLNQGLVQQAGTPHQVYLKPENRFVAQFIGQMNLLTVAASSQGLQVGGGVILKTPFAKILARYQIPFELGFRPEAVRLSPPPDYSYSITLPLQVIRYEMLGHEQLVHGRILYAPESTPLVQARIPLNHVVRSGETLTVYVESSHCHAFSLEAPGKRLPLQELL
jgi:ABC-type sugar transport system ATPase subunit